MSMIKRILLAFDFNKLTNLATDKAFYLANRFGAEIIPVHAVEYVPYHHGLNYWNPIHDEIKPRMEEAFDKLSEKGVKVHPPIIKEGRPYEVILGLAAQFNVDIIVLGSGKTHVTDTLLGTTTVRIVRNALQPVYVVHSPQRQLEIKRILCAVDLSLASNQVLVSAKNLAQMLEAHLTVLHVIPRSKKYPGLDKYDIPVVDLEIDSEADFQVKPDRAAIDERLQTKTEKVFYEYVDKIMGKNSNYRKRLRQGAPEIEIANEANTENYDLLVMGTVSQSGITRMLIGNITEKVMRNTSCSLLTLKFRNVPPSFASLDAIPSGPSEQQNFESTFAYVEGHYEKGKDFLKNESFEEAIKEFEKCLEKDQHFYAAHERLSECYGKLGNHHKAADHEEKAKDRRRFIWKLQND